LLAWSALFAIAFATAFVWAGDLKRSIRGRKYASDEKAAVARWVGRLAIAGGLVLLMGLAYAALYLNRVPHGFLPATISISLSAVVFLRYISWLRDREPLGQGASRQQRDADEAREAKEIGRFTKWLFAVAFIAALAVWINPTIVGGFAGSMVVAYFAFGAILALINAIDAAVESASGLDIVKQGLGEWATPRGLGACVAVLVIAFGALNAWLHPFHRVRLCDGGDCMPAILPDQRPTVAVAARAWYEQAKAAYAKTHGDEPVPMFIVATAGGGIRAAYWTATILEKLEEDFAAEGGARPYLFAISGVSGGSVGATAFEAALTKRDESTSKCMVGDAACPRATEFLTQDFLAPALANWIFVDAPASFLPDFGQGDRGSVLERSFEQASDGLLARPFLDLFPYGEGAMSNGGPAPPWLPILLLNGTHEETGNRIIAGHVRIDRNVFLDSLDALHVLGTDVRASTAAHNSARFTYVSPAGDLGHRNGSVIDGGYFENYGALSALELARAAKAALKDKQPAVKLVFLLISSDPSLDEKATRVRINEPVGGEKCLVNAAEREEAPSKDGAPNYLSVDPNKFENAWFNEFVAPLQGAWKVREAQGNRAAAELALEICTEFPEAPKVGTGAAQTAAMLNAAKDVSLDRSELLKARPGDPYFAHLAMCTEKPGETPTLKAPLGWALSKATQDAFKDQLFFKQCGNDEQLEQLEIALGKPAPQRDASR
jgi:hypothetical protein